MFWNNAKKLGVHGSDDRMPIFSADELNIAFCSSHISSPTDDVPEFQQLQSISELELFSIFTVLEIC